MEYIMKIDNLCKSYKAFSLKNVSFSLPKGYIMGFVGQNGSGKSTLIKGLVGLKAPSAGKIEFCGGMKKSDVGYLPQQTQLQKDFPASVQEVVLSGTRALFYGAKEKQLAKEKMQQMEILDLADKSFRDLSGGQQQRVLLARALCAAKKLLVLDEPATGLDPIVTEQMYELIAKQNQEYGMSVVMVSHDVTSAVWYADKIVHLENTVRFFGGTEHYLETSYAAQLLGGGVR
jgi:zinc transport system ATP-binding protein